MSSVVKVSYGPTHTHISVAVAKLFSSIKEEHSNEKLVNSIVSLLLYHIRNSHLQ